MSPSTVSRSPPDSQTGDRNPGSNLTASRRPKPRGPASYLKHTSLVFSWLGSNCRDDVHCDPVDNDELLGAARPPSTSTRRCCHSPAGPVSSPAGKMTFRPTLRSVRCGRGSRRRSSPCGLHTWVLSLFWRVRGGSTSPLSCATGLPAEQQHSSTDGGFMAHVQFGIFLSTQESEV